MHRIRKYIGAYAVAMNGVDAIAFTAGVGENSSLIRQRCLERLDVLGAVLDPSRNDNVRLSDAQPIDAIAADQFSRATARGASGRGVGDRA